MCSNACLPSERLRQSRLSTWQGRPWVPAFRNLRVSPAMYKGEMIYKSWIHRNKDFAVKPSPWFGMLAVQLGCGKCGKQIYKAF